MPKGVFKRKPVTPDNILYIIRGTTWRHVGGPIGMRNKGPRFGIKQPWKHGRKSNKA